MIRFRGRPTRHPALAFSLFILGFWLFTTIASVRPGLAASARSGASLAQARCSPCHAIGKSGISPNPQSPPFRELSKRYRLTDLEEAFAEGVYVGHSNMPRFVLSPRQIEDLIAYLRGVRSK